MAKDSNHHDRERARKRRVAADMAEDRAEIGEPQLTDEQRAIGERLREECRHDLEAFNAKVFPNSTGLKPFGAVQRDSIAQDQNVILGGGQVAKAEPRGFGKTTRTGNGALWAVLFGHRKMVPVFSANLDKSRTQIIGRWKAELRGNDALYWMFSELLWPLRRLENKPQRCASQTMHGRLTNTAWNADRIVLPDVPGVPGAGSVLVALPLKSCRGATHTTPSGEVLRPDLCIFDDVQRDEDAGNPATVAKLEELIDHSAMMLGGHSQTMSAIMSCTVRREGDLSEVYLKKPSWRRVRYKMLTARAETEKTHWLGRYAEIRQAFNPESPEDQRRAHLEALAFYVANREEMDRGATVTWDWAFAWKDKEPTEISAVQHSYNVLIDLGESVFASECQNEPIRQSFGLEMLPADMIMRKQSPYSRGQVPPECDVLVSKIDVHSQILYWHVWAFAPDFTGYLVDHGVFPEQGRQLFAHTSLPRPLESLFPRHDYNSTIFAGLKALNEGCDAQQWTGLLQRRWTRTDGVPMRIQRQHIDASGEAKEAVIGYTRSSAFAAVITPAYGKGISARVKPISEWQGSTVRRSTGPEWAYVKPKPGEPQSVLFDANYWKTRFHRGLALPEGSQGALYVFKDDPAEHRRLAAHWLAEAPKATYSEGRLVFEFVGQPGRDNHDFDCAVGCLVAASQCGVSHIPKPNRMKKSLLQYQHDATQLRAR